MGLRLHPKEPQEGPPEPPAGSFFSPSWGPDHREARLDGGQPVEEGGHPLGSLLVAPHWGGSSWACSPCSCGGSPLCPFGVFLSPPPSPSPTSCSSWARVGSPGLGVAPCSLLQVVQSGSMMKNSWSVWWPPQQCPHVCLPVQAGGCGAPHSGGRLPPIHFGAEPGATDGRLKPVSPGGPQEPPPHSEGPKVVASPLPPHWGGGSWATRQEGWAGAVLGDSCSAPRHLGPGAPPAKRMDSNSLQGPFWL
ncbi:uncharacterized protein LOC123255099 [Gracilinanus agilis]|uniref:uncharacterized protein LOC123255099 n=1 Tax=Gracilinanus agilis TaxID=191870 RepID=UPI001CFDC63D|nr:uncharacterized protein LOC123255099 [Gracilinanus agilis]